MKSTTITPETFGWKGVKGQHLKMGEKASIDHISISVPISKRRSSRCDRVYYILKGTVEFQFKNKKVKVKKNQAIRIPKNTIYSYKPISKIELVEINVPAYNNKYEEVDL